MSILVNDVSPRVHYLATQRQTLFQIPFAWVLNSQLKVYVNEVLCTFDAPPLDNLHYSTVGVGLTAGGTLTFGPPGRNAGDEVIIFRDMPIERTSDLPTSGVFPVATLNDTFDNQTAMIQQTEVNVQLRTLREADNDFVHPLLPIPNKYGRQGKLLGFDSNGQPRMYGVAELFGTGYGRSDGHRNWTGDGLPPEPWADGDQWFESDTGNSFVYYDDGDSRQWVQTNGTSSSGGGGEPDPVYVLRPQMFGATGSGDDTIALQNMLDAAAAQHLSVADDDSSMVYTVSATLRVKAGTRAIVMRSTIRANFTPGINQGVLHLEGTSIYGETQVNDTLVTVNIDMSGQTANVDTAALVLDGCDCCTIAGCRIFGANNVTSWNRSAITLHNGASFNKITGNEIEMFSEPAFDGRHYGINLYSGGTAEFGGFFDVPPVSFKAATNPCVGNIILGNSIRGGSYGVNIQGGVENIVSSNRFVDQNHRSIYMASSAERNTVIANIMEDFKSSAIVISYNSRYNSVIGNRMHTLVLGGEAAININTGGSFNQVLGNTIVAPTSQSIYMAVNVSGNMIVNNDMRNFFVSAIQIESNWADNPPGYPASNPYARTSWAPTTDVKPGARPSWAWGPSNANVIKGNLIQPGYSGAVGHAIGALVLTAHSGPYLIDGTAIDGNIVSSTAFIDHDLHVYEATASWINGTIVKNNVFAVNNASRVVAPGVASLATFGVCSNNSSTWLDNLMEALPVNAPVPSVASQRTRYQMANTAPTNVTGFSGGQDGQRFEVRLDVNTTLIHNNASMRLRGSVNFTGNSNIFVVFRNVSGIWFEQARNA